MNLNSVHYSLPQPARRRIVGRPARRSFKWPLLGVFVAISVVIVLYWRLGSIHTHVVEAPDRRPYDQSTEKFDDREWERKALQRKQEERAADAARIAELEEALRQKRENSIEKNSETARLDAFEKEREERERALRADIERLQAEADEHRRTHHGDSDSDLQLFDREATAKKLTDQEEASSSVSATSDKRGHDDESAHSGEQCVINVDPSLLIPDHLLRKPRPPRTFPLLTDLLDNDGGRSSPRETSKRKVLLATFEFNGGARQHGGIGTAYTELAFALANAGHEVTVLLSAVYKVEADEWSQWTSRMRTHGIRLEMAPFPELSLISADCGWSCVKSYCIFEWIRRSKTTYEVIHFPENLGLAYFTLAARRQRLYFLDSVVVIGMHGPHVWEREANERLMETHFDWEVAYQERKSVEWADVVVAPSAHVLQWLYERRHWHFPRLTVVNQNIIGEVPSLSDTVDASSYSLLAAGDADTDIGTRPLSRAQLRELVFFGRLEQRKGAYLFADAIDFMLARTEMSESSVLWRGVSVVWMGKDPRNVGAHLQRRCKSWFDQLGIICVFHTSYARDSALAYLGERDSGRVAVMPSLTENSPYTVLEALRMRVPFIATLAGGVGELVADGAFKERQLVHPDAVSLANAVERVLRDGALRGDVRVPVSDTRSAWLRLHAIDILALAPNDEYFAANDASGNASEEEAADDRGATLPYFPEEDVSASTYKSGRVKLSIGVLYMYRERADGMSIVNVVQEARAMAELRTFLDHVRSFVATTPSRRGGDGGGFTGSTLYGNVEVLLGVYVDPFLDRELRAAGRSAGNRTLWNTLVLPDDEERRAAELDMEEAMRRVASDARYDHLHVRAFSLKRPQQLRAVPFEDYHSDERPASLGFDPRTALPDVARARNLLAEQAHGGFLLFMDVDERVLVHDALDRLVYTAHRTKADIVAAQVRVADDSHVLVAANPHDIAREARDIELYLGCDDAAFGAITNCFGSALALMRRSVFDMLGGFASDRFGGDNDTWPLYARAVMSGARITPSVDVLFSRPLRADSPAYELAAPSTEYARRLRVGLAVQAEALPEAGKRTAVYLTQLDAAMIEQRAAHKLSLEKAAEKCRSRMRRKEEAGGDTDAAALVSHETSNKGVSMQLTQCEQRLRALREQSDADQQRIEQLQSELTAAQRAPTSGVAKQRGGGASSTRLTAKEKNAFAEEIERLRAESANWRRKFLKKCPPSMSFDAVAPNHGDGGDAKGVYVERSDGTRQRQRIVFIRGHEKSGTTWVRSVLALHPDVNMVPREFQFNFMATAVDRFTGDLWMGGIPSIKRAAHEWYIDFVHSMLRTVALKHPDKKWIGEKSPKQLAPLFPDAKYVYVIRDGRDVLVSLFWHHVRLDGFVQWCDGDALVQPQHVKEWRKQRDYFARNPRLLLTEEKCVRMVARSWRQYLQRDLDTMEALARLRDNPDETLEDEYDTLKYRNEVFVVKYEEFLNDAERIRSDMYRYLDLDPTEARELMEWDLTKPGIPESQSRGFFRRGVAGDWRNFFHREAARWFAEEAGDMLVTLGYEEDADINTWGEMVQ